MAKKNSLKIDLFHKAIADLGELWQWNASHYGTQHADDYRAFVEQEIERLADFPSLGEITPRFPTVRRILVKKPSAKYGHLIFYRVFEGRILVLRVLHTAQDWQSRDLDSE